MAYGLSRRQGFTLVELLVVIAIIAIMVLMLLPGLGAVREMARRSQCEHRVMKVALALEQYELAHEVFPAGVRNPTGPVLSQPDGLHQGWVGELLPFLGREVVYEHLQRDASVYAEENAEVRRHRIVDLICPSEDVVPDEWPASSFAGCHHDVEAPIDEDNHGILYLNSQTRLEDIPDGVEFTLLLGEKRVEKDDLGWLSGTRATLRNTGLPVNAVRGARRDPAAPGQPQAGGQPAGIPPSYVGGFGSAHPAGAHAAMADGSVRFISNRIDLSTWQQLGHRSDGSMIDEMAWD